MWFLSLIGVATCAFFSVCLVIFIWFVLKADTDLTLLFAEKFGRKLDALKGKVIWITGASSGIGEHLAYLLAPCHCKLVLSGTNNEALKNVKHHCLMASNLQDEDILVLPFDISDYKVHEDCVKKVLDHFTQIDILVNNAGRTQRAEFQKIKIDVDHAMFGINVFGAVNLTREVLKHFMNVGRGHVVVTSSTAGKLGAPYSATYTGSKHALHGYFEALRMELNNSNIHVTLICPGPVFSNITERAFTETTNKVYGLKSSPVDRRMATDRCSYLMGVAIANKLDEVWISIQPVLLLHYLAQYTPTFFRVIIVKYFFTKERVSALREGKN